MPCVYSPDATDDEQDGTDCLHSCGIECECDVTVEQIVLLFMGALNGTNPTGCVTGCPTATSSTMDTMDSVNSSHMDTHTQTSAHTHSHTHTSPVYSLDGARNGDPVTLRTSDGAEWTLRFLPQAPAAT